MDKEVKRERAIRLMEAYLENNLTTAEYAELWEILSGHFEDEHFRSVLTAFWENTAFNQVVIPPEVWDKNFLLLKEQLENKNTLQRQKTIVRRLYRFKWAAAVLLLVSTGFTLFFILNRKQPASIAADKKIPPAQLSETVSIKDKAFLTLADGTHILLDSTTTGTIAKQGKTRVIKQNVQELVYQPEGNNTNQLMYNTLTTARGGTYKLTLADGTKVWLNAASSIKFPASFNGKDRRVAISGEVYFEVAKDPSRRFKVSVVPKPTAGEMEIEVTGTRFNINSYSNENAVRTALLEGSVRLNTVSNTRVLKPGQQASYFTTGEVNVANKTDIEETVAWKDGNFQFDNTDISYVMRQLERWYDINVSYTGNINKHFSGTIPRSTSLLKVLDILQRTGEVKFEVEGNKITVSP